MSSRVNPRLRFSGLKLPSANLQLLASCDVCSCGRGTWLPSVEVMCASESGSMNCEVTMPVVCNRMFNKCMCGKIAAREIFLLSSFLHFVLV